MKIGVVKTLKIKNQNEEENVRNSSIINSIELLERPFTNVFVNDDLLKIYFNFEKGLIGFEDLGGELWVFDRFE
ncbi:MAG: hypothetical protein GY705_18030 [Bacteroidetes bacterium]|nr:hypothetical protein [Bacteroidota bacterium]